MFQYEKFIKGELEGNKWLRPLLDSHFESRTNEVEAALKGLKGRSEKPSLDEFVTPIRMLFTYCLFLFFLN